MRSGQHVYARLLLPSHRCHIDDTARNSSETRVLRRDQSKCVRGAKQMLVWHRKFTPGRMLHTLVLFVNEPSLIFWSNIEAQGEDNTAVTGMSSPGYNTKCGWASGMINASPILSHKK